MMELYCKEDEGFVDLYHNDEESLAKTETVIKAQISSIFSSSLYEENQSQIRCGNRGNCRTEVYHNIYQCLFVGRSSEPLKSAPLIREIHESMNIKTVELDVDGRKQFHYLDDYTEYENSGARRSEEWMRRILQLLLRH